MVLEEREADASFPGASRRVTEIEVDMSDEVDRSLLPIRRPPFKDVADKTLGGGQRYNQFHVTAMCSPTRAALPPGWAEIVAIYDLGKADTVDAALASAMRKSVAQVDGGGAKKLKAALAAT